MRADLNCCPVALIGQDPNTAFPAIVSGPDFRDAMLNHKHELLTRFEAKYSN